MARKVRPPNIAKRSGVGEPTDAVYGFQFHPEPTVDMLLETRKGRRWFDTIPAREDIERTVEAGRKALAAWVALAVA